MIQDVENANGENENASFIVLFLFHIASLCGTILLELEISLPWSIFLYYKHNFFCKHVANVYITANVHGYVKNEIWGIVVFFSVQTKTLELLGEKMKLILKRFSNLQTIWKAWW